MTITEIIQSARNILNDTLKPYLVQDQELVTYLNLGLADFCDQTKIITDSTTASTGVNPNEVPLCTIPLVAGTCTYEIHPLILEVVKAKTDLRSRSLYKISTPELELRYPQWEQGTGTPSAFLLDLDSLTIRLIPKPTENDTLHLTVRRLPLITYTPADLEKELIPEIPAKYHRNLVSYILYRCYAKEDVEVQSMKSDKAYQDYLAGVDLAKRYMNIFTYTDHPVILPSGLF